MAGSYHHCTNEDGSFIGDDFASMIENLGDAHEACEMMHWMIGHLAGGDITKITVAQGAYYAYCRAEGGSDAGR
jgi:hypothetical protein